MERAIPGARGTVSWVHGRCSLIINLFIHSVTKNGLNAHNGPGTALSVRDASVNKGDRDPCPQEAHTVVGDKISKFNSLLEDETCRVGRLGLLDIIENWEVGVASMKWCHLHKDIVGGDSLPRLCLRGECSRRDGHTKALR